MSNVLPITLIGGYLGSGKTTLVNRLLADPALPDGTAVLVNDFGDINIDESLIRSQSADGTVIGLSNGCICCSIRDDLSQALDQLTQLSVKQVIVEASGVAEPVRIWQHCHYPGFAPKAAVVLVDASQIHQRLQDKYVGKLAQAQLDQAHLLVISKTDLNPAFQLNRLQPSFSSNDPALVATVLGWQQSTQPAAPLPRTVQFGAHTWQQQQELPLAVLERFLREMSDQVHRAKGWVKTDAGYYQVSAVGKELSLEAVTGLPSGAQLGLVFIYRLDSDAHTGGFAPDQITMTLSG
jgi:G3E family GTPase